MRILFSNKTVITQLTKQTIETTKECIDAFVNNDIDFLIKRVNNKII